MLTEEEKELIQKIRADLSILELANKDAENRKKEEIFKAKEEIMNARNELDKEIIQKQM